MTALEQIYSLSETLTETEIIREMACKLREGMILSGNFRGREDEIRGQLENRGGV